VRIRSRDEFVSESSLAFVANRALEEPTLPQEVVVKNLLVAKHHLKLASAGLCALLPACSSGNAGTEQPSVSVSPSIRASDTTGGASAAAPTCALNSPSGAIQHLIYVQFDNVHFTRDNPNVPSDLEQMPNLLNFLTANGSLHTNHHTPLIAHTSDDIITSLTGVYGDKHGAAVGNSYGYFNPPGSKYFDGIQSAFTYWTDPAGDGAFNLLSGSKTASAPQGVNAPAPWVPFTRAGCNVGAVSIADMELENTSSDFVAVFSSNPTLLAQAQAEAKAYKTNHYKAVADYEGIAVHCASGDPLCATANNGVPDLLPSEPGGYSGYNALFGHVFVAPQISPGVPLTDLDGNVITDGNGNDGFPGFGGISAAQTLGYVAAMQEHNVPITFAYISDAHDDHATGLASGPGQADYVAQLQGYDRAWGEFFSRLANDGITPANTLFVITSDEGDHFAGGPPSPANCDGVTVPCTYAKIGEIDTNLTALIDAVDSSLASTPFDIHFDMAPTFYVSGNPAPGSAIARKYEQAAAQLTAVSPITGNTDTLMRFLADPVEMSTLHMVTADPNRTPTFVMFGDPDYYFQTYGTPTLNEAPYYAWNHGGVAPEINTTWLGLVGPGIGASGVDSATWSDHTDIRPTILSLVGLADDYAHDGRVLFESIDTHALPAAVDRPTFIQLSHAYKSIMAPVGDLGLTTLALSTTGLAGDDATYAQVEAQIQSFTAQRDALAAQMIQMLEAAAFGGQPIDATAAGKLEGQAKALLQQVHKAAGG
jgi:hypothetical protein